MQWYNVFYRKLSLILQCGLQIIVVKFVAIGLRRVGLRVQNFVKQRDGDFLLQKLWPDGMRNSVCLMWR